VRELIPKRARQAARNVLRAPVYLRLAKGLAGARTLARLENSTTQWRPGELVAVRLRELDGRRLFVRPESSDRWVILDTFLGGAHLPPDGFGAADVRTVWDLGAHIGSTSVHIAARYPHARVVAVELDPDNAEIARRNASEWDGRVTIVEGAVWFEDGEISFAPAPGDEVSGHVTPGEDGGVRAAAHALQTLLDEHTPGDTVDYVKMDVEGAEREILRRNTGWAQHVRSIKVEVHEPYTIDECVADLRALGFTASVEYVNAEGPGKPEVLGTRTNG
jgi:FkbM family methyltransferase